MQWMHEVAVRSLNRVDLMRIGPLQVTHIPRTLVDLADVMDRTAFRALADSHMSLALPQLRAAQACVVRGLLAGAPVAP